MGTLKTANEGMILQLQGFSVNDGEGIRTVIFMAGCPLRCKWCANPETWDMSPKLAVYDARCAHCGKCRDACPQSLFPPKMNAPNYCKGCEPFGACVSACPNGALAVLCEKKTVDEVVKIIGRSEIFYRHSGGGVTFSGGEPTVQEGFLRAATNRLYERGVSIWIETCGYFNWESVKDIFELTEHVFYDIKFMDTEAHKRFTGADNAVILSNCISIYNAGIPVTVRLPSVKDINFTEENLEKTASFMRANLPHSRIELLPYHDFGHEKYTALRMNEHINEFQTPTPNEISEAYGLFRRFGIEPIEYK